MKKMLKNHFVKIGTFFFARDGTKNFAIDTKLFYVIPGSTNHFC